MKTDLLRITSVSNGKSAYLAAFASAAASIVFTALAIIPEHSDPGVGPVFGTFGILSFVLFLCMLQGLIVPFQREFVMETNLLRYGRVDRPSAQRQVKRAEVICFVLDDGPDASLCINIGKWLSPHLAGGILQDVSQMVETAKAIQMNWPEIPVYDREEYQNLCRLKLNRKPRT
jgi:hypothetical protein